MYTISLSITDNEGNPLGLASLAELPTEAEENFSDTDDSEKEDEKLKSDDNLILVGRVDGDASTLEVYGLLFICLND